MSPEIRPGWTQTQGPPEWTFTHTSGWRVVVSTDSKDRRPYKLVSPAGEAVRIHPYRAGFFKRCQAMAIGEFFARNPLLFAELQRPARPL